MSGRPRTISRPGAPASSVHDDDGRSCDPCRTTTTPPKVDPSLADELEERLNAVTAAVRRTLSRSATLLAASQKQRDGSFATRCAWCGRVAVATQFLEPEETPSFLLGSHGPAMTHGICPECVAELRRTGQSH
jgi:hypothetical protein